MRIITFLSDYGTRDYYCAAVKAVIISRIPQQVIVDISHAVESCNTWQAAFTLSAVFRDFPAGSIHLVAVGGAGHKTMRHLLVEAENHFFIGPDNGLFGLFLKDVPTKRFMLSPNEQHRLFPGKSLYAPVAAALAAGAAAHQLGQPTDHWDERYMPPPKKETNLLKGRVCHVDQHGNLITDISRQDFLQVAANRRFSVQFEYERIQTLDEGYESQEYGDCVVFFNNMDLLEIAINHGNAAQLLGMRHGSPVHIRFSPTDQA